jgi:energy-coupling factor transporter ATP-binding protein EcfA2
LRKVVLVTGDLRLAEGTFKKCDMHVHSSSCYSRRYDEKTFSSSVLHSDLDVLAVTDHNSVDVELLERLQVALAKRSKTLIGGVEINVKLKKSTIDAYHLVPGDGEKGDYFHAIVWFAMEQAAAMSAIVDELFVSAILAAKEEDGLTKESLSALPRKQFSRMTEGIAIYLEDFQEKAASIPHFFIPHENKDRSLSDYLPNGSRKNPLLANQAYKDRLFYYSHAMAVEGGEKSRKAISDGLAKELHATVAALFFSDALTADKIGSKFTWIDFDGDLDSLLLAISDPESRIKTSDECPSLPQTNTASFLESVSFDMLTDGDGGSCQTFKLAFSPGFNGIVGSRGSGKSLLACLLAGKGLDTYAKFVDEDSVKFTMHGGVPMKDHPSCLYLGQGELECIYRDGKYEEIPFLGEHVSPLKADAEKESGKAKSRLIEILDLEKKLLLAFCAKYESGSIRMDHLDSEMPSGVSIDAPTYPAKDWPKIDKARSELSSMEESLASAAKTASSITFKSSYPEDEELFVALDDEASAIKGELTNLRQRVARLSLFLNEVNPEWFEGRDQLVSLFETTIGEYNNASGSTALTQYGQKTAKVAAFLDDLLELRLSLDYLNEQAQRAYEKMHKPIDPVELQNEADRISINLVYSEESTFDEKFAEPLSSSTTRNHQTLVEAFLCQRNSDRMHKKFNGNKVKISAKQGIVAHYNKFFELVKKEVTGSDSLSVIITLKDVSIDDMSPGTKAQALLKLFLNDEVVAGRWVYIVLDQPEDNLDVATIKDFLIDRLKKLKLNVQFFVVSHSAPVVVNGDARTVVVCKNDEGSISYTSGVMNDSHIKQSIADVLDGGERYLKMRLNKYNFQVGDER